jgi:hypothetical protein
MRSAVFVLLCSSSIAFAQDASGPAFSLERFRPAVDGNGMVTVNASETLGHLDFSLGLTGSYTYRTLSLRASAPTSTRKSCTQWTTSPSRCVRAKWWDWSANRAAASRRWGA